MFSWLIQTQLWLADDSLGLANLTVPTYWGGQVAGQMPSSSAPQWKISTFLTGQMSDTWQDCHPDSPTESLQTGYQSLPEIKVIFLFQTLSLSCLSVFTWSTRSTFNSSHSQGRKGDWWLRHWSLMRGRTLTYPRSAAPAGITAGSLSTLP